MDVSKNILELLTKNDNPIVALLAFMVLALAAVVVYQWKYTANKTVPKWVWDNLITKIEQGLDLQSKMMTIIDERLKKK